MSYANLVANALGGNVLDVQSVAKQATKDHRPDTRLDLRELPSLAQQRDNLVSRIADLRNAVNKQAPVVAHLRRKATEAIDALTAATSTEFVGNRTEIHNRRRDADSLETRWADESKWLERTEARLTSTERELKEFDKGPNGERLTRLRELDKALDTRNRK
ncbi:MAG: hypothetical protein WA213_21655 [Terriglobales bacterium]